MDVSISTDILGQLNTPEARAVHDIIDSLSNCGVGKLVNLPQIIVVGSQSSGKSSVLEAITRVRFPVEGGLCTRFATELVLHTAEQTRVNVSVKFEDKGKAPQSFHREDFKEEDLPEIIEEAKRCMGFATAAGGAGKKFSRDVLRLEISGPKMYPLTLVDLPGLFQNITATQSFSDMVTVNELVRGYMEAKNSIILVVITANNQLASHIALNEVKKVDPQGQRTIGVITKPDLTTPGYSDEKTYIQVAKNQEAENKLQLGWHVLRNRAENETSLDARDSIEESFFKSGAWASIPRSDRGIDSLRKKLSSVMYTHIKNGLPRVITDIEEGLRKRQEQLERLGKARPTQDDMRSFLLSTAGDFQRLARDGVYGQYNDPFFGGLDEERGKLRAQLRNFNRAFDFTLRTKGAAQRVIPAGKKNVLPEDWTVEDHLDTFLKRHPYDFPVSETIKREDLSSQLQQLAAANQGREFPGSPNKDLVIQLFKKQAEPWKKIAEYHIESVTTVAKAFVDQVFIHVLGEPNTNPTTEAILSTCVDPFFEKRQLELKSKLEELLRPYIQGFALPLDADFYEAYSKDWTNKLAHQVHGILHRNPSLTSTETGTVPTVGVIQQAIASEQQSHHDEFGVETVIDMMLVYYEMSRRTFTDNVINLAIESCLICHIPDILTPTMVDSMDKERLSELAAESEEITTRRGNLQEEVDILRQGLAQCRRYKPRQMTMPSTNGTASSDATGPSNSLAANNGQKTSVFAHSQPNPQWFPTPAKSIFDVPSNLGLPTLPPSRSASTTPQPQFAPGEKLTTATPSLFGGGTTTNGGQTRSGSGLFGGIARSGGGGLSGNSQAGGAPFNTASSLFGGTQPSGVPPSNSQSNTPATRPFGSPPA